MFKVIEIEEKKIPMMSNGGTFREYRHFFHRDLFSDLMKLQGIEKGEDFDLGVLENVAWTLAHRANPSLEDIDGWLSQFDDPMSLLNASQEIIELIAKSQESTVPIKKNSIPKKAKKK